VARIKLGLQDRIYLGNLDSKRDWGYASDYVEAMWLMLQQDQPEDFVIATGETHSVREFVEKAFRAIDIPIQWSGSGIDEIGFDRISGQTHVEIDPRYFRPTEVDFLLGDPAKAMEKLGWEPKVSFQELIDLMMEEDIREAQRDQFCKKKGFVTYDGFE
jgi:GDPmannose 4,6-dehydratase